MTYTETVTRNGETHTGTVTDTEALTLVRRARRLGYKATAAKDQTVTIVRERGNRAVATVVLRPQSATSRLSETQYRDLSIIEHEAKHARIADGAIRTLTCRIPPAATRRLIERGLIVASGIRVEISLAGRLAMAAHRHKVWTVGASETVGGDFTRYHTLTGVRMERTGYFVTAYCACHKLASHQTERASAQRAARAHLEENLTAALIGA